MNSQRVDLINERQHETHGLLGKKSEICGINLLRGQWVHFKNYNYLNLTQLLASCSSVVQLLPLWIVDLCGSIRRLEFLNHHQASQKKLCRLFCWHSLCFSKELIVCIRVSSTPPPSLKNTTLLFFAKPLPPLNLKTIQVLCFRQFPSIY